MNQNKRYKPEIDFIDVERKKKYEIACSPLLTPSPIAVDFKSLQIDTKTTQDLDSNETEPSPYCSALLEKKFNNQKLEEECSNKKIDDFVLPPPINSFLKEEATDSPFSRKLLEIKMKNQFEARKLAYEEENES